MKPYKIIKSQNPNLKKTKLVGILKAPKVPLYFIKNCHTPKKSAVVLSD